MDSNTFLRRFAERARREPSLLGSLIAAYQDLANVSDSDLAAELDAEEGALVRLAICGHPRPDQFTADVAAIAERTGISAFRLAPFLRKVVALTRFRHERGGNLRAARRHEDDEAP